MSSSWPSFEASLASLFMFSRIRFVHANELQHWWYSATLSGSFQYRVFDIEGTKVVQVQRADLYIRLYADQKCIGCNLVRPGETYHGNITSLNRATPFTLKYDGKPFHLQSIWRVQIITLSFLTVMPLEVKSWCNCAEMTRCSVECCRQYLRGCSDLYIGDDQRFPAWLHWFR